MKKKLLVLSVGYGQGHHSAAKSLSEYYALRGWDSQIVDVCKLGQPRIFRWTQRFYDCCVKSLPWLWRITYALTDTADWSRLVKSPVLRDVMKCLKQLLRENRPDLIICTYPLFAYMLDAICAQGERRVPYVVVVTDAREISRPWLCSDAQLIIVPDAGTRELVLNRYAISETRVVAAGFPVRKEFSSECTQDIPSLSNLRVLYGAYRQICGVKSDVRALLDAFPQMRLTVLAGRHAVELRRSFSEYEASGQLQIIQETQDMAGCIKRSHLYIGKAGAATMFECYACMVPILINYTLPGQEQGNLELLLDEGCGCHVESTSDLVATLQMLLHDDAREWRKLHNAMKIANRINAVQNIDAAIEDRFRI